MKMMILIIHRIKARQGEQCYDYSFLCDLGESCINGICTNLNSIKHSRKVLGDAGWGDSCKEDRDCNDAERQCLPTNTLRLGEDLELTREANRSGFFGSLDEKLCRYPNGKWPSSGMCKYNEECVSGRCSVWKLGLPGWYCE